MSQITDLSSFLKYGPIGLAALMLVLVIIALGQPDLGSVRERLLKHFMYIGTFCFAIALAATFFARPGSYALHFRVIPLDAGSKRIFPLPIITVNNNTISATKPFMVNSEVTAIVDVTDALSYVQQVRSQNTEQRQVLNAIVGNSDSLLADLQRVPQMIDKNCPGGVNHYSTASNRAVLAITSRVAAAISGNKATAKKAIATRVPELK